MPDSTHARHQAYKTVQEKAKIGHEKIRGQAGYALIVASEQHRDHQAFEENKVKPEYDKDGKEEMKRSGQNRVEVEEQLANNNDDEDAKKQKHIAVDEMSYEIAREVERVGGYCNAFFVSFFDDF